MKQLLLLAGLLTLAPGLHAQSSAHLAALAYLNANAAALGLTAADYSDLVALSEHTSAPAGATFLYLQQRSSGVPVNGAISSVAVRSGAVAAFNARLVPGLAAKVNSATPAISAAAALATAAANRGIGGLAGAATVLGDVTTFAVGTLDVSPQVLPTARLVYEKASASSYRLAWQVGLYASDEQHYWNVRVDAASNTVLAVNDEVISERPTSGRPVATDAGLARVRAVPAAAAPRFSLYANPSVGPVARAAAMAVSGSYRVYDRPVESPNHASPAAPTDGRTLVTTGGDATASSFGWLNDGLLDYNTTRGNNVYAYLDNAGGEVGTSPVGTVGGLPGLPGQALTFDYPVDFAAQPGAYANAAVTNLFYWNNLMHDVFYYYGFDEPSGNFQNTNNAGVTGGVGADGVIAQAQDGGGTNNANFLTLADGVSGRMQMYLWDPSDPASLVINDPGSLAGTFVAQEAAFGPAFGDPGTTGDFAYNVANPTSCGTALPDGSTLPTTYAGFSGKVALIVRGGCSFVEKARNAQLSGALALVVVNNVPGAPITMGSSSPAPAGPDPIGSTILIPSGMISQADGAPLIAELSSVLPATVNGTLVRTGGATPQRDGDFDNAVISHEYGHGISTRLVGGPAKPLSCLTSAEQGGEGWSDFFGLLMTNNGGTASHGIGTYVTYQGVNDGGIRPAPYSTSLGTNTYTYAQLNNAEILEPHGVGFIWATMLNEMAASFIARYGSTDDLTDVHADNQGESGNVRALKVVMTGLKLTPCAPGFVDQRNAILQADRLLYGGADTDIIWAAFAKRGLGYSAAQGDPDVRGDETVAFDLPPASASATLEITRRAAGAGPNAQDRAAFTQFLTVTNHAAATVTGVVVRDTLDARTVFVARTESPGGVYDPATGILTWPAVSLAPGASVVLSYQAFAATGEGATLAFQDDVESGDANWVVGAGVNQWSRVTTSANSGTTAWFAADPDNPSLQTLTMANAVTIPTGGVLSFTHSFATESGFDGGTVELSTDDGLTWTDLGPYITDTPYNPTPISPADNPLFLGGSAFHGSSDGFVTTRVDLSGFAGQDAKVRFVFKSDYLTAATGWWVDDIEIVANRVAVTARGGVRADGGVAVDEQIETIVLAGAAGAYTAVTGAALLGGAYNAGTGLMNAMLGTGGHLPFAQPFADAAFDGTPMDYDGAESVGAGFFASNPEIVDWVLVELRSGTGAGTVTQRAPAFVLNTGLVVGLDGVSPLVFDGVAPASRYVVVRHRNHLAVMTSAAQAPSGALLRGTFTGGQAYGANALCDLGGGRYGLCGGDADANGQVQNSDKNTVWRTQVGLSGYHAADFDLNGQVQNSDKNTVWRVTVGRSTNVN